MDTSKFIDELVRDEGIRLKPYRDSVRSAKYPEGILTIGIGRNLEQSGITREEAYHLAQNDIERVTVDLEENFQWWRELDEVRQRVLANMCFNMGIHSLMEFRKMLAAMQMKRWADAVAEMKASHWHPQVGIRAERLEQMILTGVAI